MTVRALLLSMDSAEISEWMAFDRLKDDDYRAKLESKTMTEDERNKALKALLGGQ